MSDSEFYISISFSEDSSSGSESRGVLDVNEAGDRNEEKNWEAVCTGNAALLANKIKSDTAFLQQLDEQGHNVIYVGSQHGHVDVVRLLAELKADVNAADKNGSTPCHAGSQNGHVDVVHLHSL